MGLSVGSALSSGVAGLQDATQRLDRAAELTRAATVPSDQVTLGQDPLVDATVMRVTAEVAFKANLKVIQSADQLSDALLALMTR